MQSVDAEWIVVGCCGLSQRFCNWDIFESLSRCVFEIERFPLFGEDLFLFVYLKGFFSPLRMKVERFSFLEYPLTSIL